MNNSSLLFIFLSFVSALMIFNYIQINKIAIAQGPPYLKTNTIKVPPSSNATANAFCKDGDGIIQGGYSIGFHSINAAFNTMLYSNHPIQQINKTGYFEGWQVGLVNKGNETVALSATTLCLDLRLTP
jgi:hypothetical protein